MSPGAAGSGPVSAVILAGGASRRLGRDKALVEIGGRPLLARVLDAAAPSADELLLVTADRKAHGRALRDAGWRIADDGRLRLLSDRRPGRGPLAGLEAGLAEARHDLCLALACDLPFLPPEVPARLLDALARWRAGGDGSGPPRAVVPVAEGRRQSLCVAVERRAGAEAAACLDADEPSVAAWLDRVEVREMTLRELAAGHEEPGAAPRWMMDVDTPDALEEARRLASGAGPP